ncbi:MAG: matrixin family metalloprotease [Methanothrix sp.]
MLRNDAYLTGEGLSPSAVQSAVAAAANTWDAATNQNIFADSSLVTASTTVSADIYDRNNVVAWKPVSGSALAYSRTWFNYNKVDGYNTAVESDIVFNTGYTWRTDGLNGGFDVQSVALHELGHTLGLGDLYGKTQFNDDTRLVMHYYTGIKRTLRKRRFGWYLEALPLTPDGS